MNTARDFTIRHSPACGSLGEGWSFVISMALLVLFAARALGVGGVDSPPSPSAPSETRFAQPNETKLENGLRVIVANRPGLPMVAAQVVIGTGAEADPADLAGTASMTGALLAKGTESMSAPQIAQTIESLGGDI